MWLTFHILLCCRCVPSPADAAAHRLLTFPTREWCSSECRWTSRSLSILSTSSCCSLPPRITCCAESMGSRSHVLRSLAVPHSCTVQDKTPDFSVRLGQPFCLLLQCKPPPQKKNTHRHTPPCAVPTCLTIMARESAICALSASCRAWNMLLLACAAAAPDFAGLCCCFLCCLSCCCCCFLCCFSCCCCCFLCCFSCCCCCFLRCCCCCCCCCFLCCCGCCCCCFLCCCCCCCCCCFLCCFSYCCCCFLCCFSYCCCCFLCCLVVAAAASCAVLVVLLLLPVLF